MDDDIKESSDRLILLAKKYASETANLSKEENARLEMINQRMDLRFPRYSAKDWKLLDEAKTLIGELSSISDNSEYQPTRRTPVLVSWIWHRAEKSPVLISSKKSDWVSGLFF